MTDYSWTKDVRSDNVDENPVFVHVKAGNAAGQWLNVIRNFSRIPCVGEFIAIDDHGHIFQVDLVVHTPTSEQMVAEVYCTDADFSGEVKTLIRKLWPE